MSKARPYLPSSDYLLQRIDALTREYAFLRGYDIGQSVLGRPLRVMEIGEGEKQIFVSATHHGNEWITALLLLRYAKNYAEAFATGGRICGEEAAFLCKQTKLYLLPLVNPDGADIAMGMLDERYNAILLPMAKTRPDVPYPSGWKANFNGTDLNLNYPAGWEIARRNKEKQGVVCPGPRDWVGDYALSEPESRALYLFTRMHDFFTVLAFHTQGEEIYYSYGDKEVRGAQSLGQKLASASGYSLSKPCYASAFAGYKDWFIQAFAKPGFTIEAGMGCNPLPLCRLDGIYQKTAPLITAALNAAAEL